MHRLMAFATCLLLAACGRDAPLVHAPQEIAVEPKELDFGELFTGSSSTRTVTVRNQGRAAVDLTVVDVTPPFTVSSPRLNLDAGATQEVRISFSPPRSETSAGRLKFVTNSGRFAAVDLTGRGIPRSVDFPDDIDFGRVVVGSTASQEVTFTNLTAAALVLALVPPSRAFDVEPRSLPLAPHESAVATLTFLPDTPGPRIQDLEVLRCSDCPPQSIALRGNAILPDSPSLAVSPPACHFGLTEVGRSRVCEVSLWNDGELPVDLERPSVSPPFSIDAIAIPPRLDPGAEATLPISFHPDAAGKFDAKIALQDRAGIQFGGIFLSGEAGSPVSVAPAAIAFGVQPVGYRSRRIITLTSTDGRSRTIRTASVEGTGAVAYRLRSPLEGKVVSTNPLQVEIEFRSDQEGTFVAELVIDTAEVSGVKARASLSGRVMDTNCDPLPRFTNAFPPDEPTRIPQPSCECIEFGKLGSNPHYERSIRLFNHGDRECLVWDFAYEDHPGTPHDDRDAAFTLLAPEGVVLLEPGAWVDLTLRYQPSLDPCPAALCAAHDETIVPFVSFRHSNYRRPKSTIPIFAAAPERALEISPATTVDFGEVRIGDEKSITLEIRAATDIPDTFARSIRITWPACEHEGDFFLDPNSIDQFSPGPIDRAGLRIPVYFSPATKGFHTRLVQIYVDNGHLASIIFQLWGNGIEP